jgi:hypothetical protein
VTRRRAVLLLWLLLTAWTGALYARAALMPPPGRAFAGTFHWIDDAYNYVSYAQQAEDGAFVFRNKLAPAGESRARLVNLEWWLVGRLSLLVGRRPFLAYRIVAILATLALVAGAERWLASAGVPGPHRLPALLLVCVAGGLGGPLFEWTDLPARRCLDLAVAFFPFLEILANPHFAAGTALLAWALWAFAEVPGTRGVVTGVALGTILGLVRPYDVALLGAVRGVAALAAEPPRRWPRAAAQLLGLVPVLAYDFWVFFGSDEFASFRRGAPFPRWVDFAPALAPAAGLALASLRRRAAADDRARGARAHLWAWFVVAAGVMLVGRGGDSLQVVVGAGLPLLVLGAVALSRFQARWTALAALLLSPSAVVATTIVLAEDPNWFVPRERLATALALRDLCRPGDRVLAPPDIGLYAIGLSACDAFVSHPAAPGWGLRLQQTRAFYETMGPAVRTEFLDGHGITHFVLPGDAGPSPVPWLGPATPFRVAARVGRPPAQIAIYERPRAAAAVPSSGERVR